MGILHFFFTFLKLSFHLKIIPPMKGGGMPRQNICPFLQYIIIQGGKGDEEAGENRNYLATRMTEEVSEIIRCKNLTFLQ